MPGSDFGKWVQPQAIAEVILFLASPAARAISGALSPTRVVNRHGILGEVEALEGLDLKRSGSGKRSILKGPSWHVEGQLFWNFLRPKGYFSPSAEKRACFSTPVEFLPAPFESMETVAVRPATN